MKSLPQEAREAWENRDGAIILATVNESGTPNIIYATCVGLYEDGRIVVADNYFDKTRKNIQADSKGAILFITKDKKAYQIKGYLEYHTEGKIFDLMKSWNPEQHPGHAAAALVPEVVFLRSQKTGLKKETDMSSFTEKDISLTILESYYTKLERSVESDVIIAGSGPSGLMAAWRLAQKNMKVLVLEKRLSPGGGIWGGSIGMNEIAVQKEVLPILEEVQVHYKKSGMLFSVDAVELASALCLKSIQSGATILNLMQAEDLCVKNGRVTGVVANRTLLGDKLPIDPLTFTAEAVIDATGHEMVLSDCLRKRGLLEKKEGISIEGPMDAPAGEKFVVENVSEIYPGLWITGMGTCSFYGGPRMGPIFGGMLMSGAKTADMIAERGPCK